MRKIKEVIFRDKFILILLVVVLCAGFYLRIGGILTNSFAFTYDVGRDMLQVQKIVYNHKIPLIGQTTGLGGLYYGPWWYYILTPPFAVFNGSPQGIAFFMVIVGLCTIIFGYLLGLVMGDRWLGAMMAVLLSLSSVMVGFSSQIWNPNMAPFFLLLLFILLFINPQKKGRRFINYSGMGLLLGLILDSEIVFGTLVIIGIVFSLIYLKRKKLFSLTALGIPLGFIIILLPRLFFELRHNFIMTKSLFSLHTGDQRIFDLGNSFTVLPGRLLEFLSQFSDTFGVDIKIGFILFLLICLCFFFFRKKLAEPEKKLGAVILIIMGVFVAGSAVFARALWGHYLVGLPVIYIIFTSLAFIPFIRRYKVAGIILFIVLSIISIRPIDVIASNMAPLWEGNAAVYRNQVAAIDYVYREADGKHFNYIVYTPAVHDYTYRYIFSWYGKNKYGYLPSVKTKHLFYVIIEPDPGNDQRIKDWLKIREGDGKVIKQKIVKGGIMVQTRIR